MPGKKDGLRELTDEFLKRISDAGSEALLAELVNRVTLGMDPGDRFYHAKDKTWWEWRGGRLMSSGPPKGYRRG